MALNITIRPGKSDLNCIQSALDRIKAAGRGKLILTEGSHISNPLRLVSNLELILEKGAVLTFMADPFAYPLVWTRWEGTECYAIQPMIYAENSKCIYLHGKGIIDGNGAVWWEWYRKIRDGIVPAELESGIKEIIDKNNKIVRGSGGGGAQTGFLRPPLLQFKNCSDIKIRELTIRNSAFWNTHILYSSDVLIELVNFFNPGNSANTDGLDIDSSRNVLISSCMFDTGDDCVCLKSGMDEDGRKIGIPCESVIIRDCTMKRGHGAVVFGSESAAGIHDVTVENCRFLGTDRGIRLKTRRGRGGVISGISVESVYMNDVICPVSVNMFYRCGLDEKDLKRLSDTGLHKVDSTTPAVRDIVIKNVRAENVKSAAGYFCGLPENPITGIKLENIEISLAGPGRLYEPAMDMFFTQSGPSGFIIKFSEEPVMKNVRILTGSGIKYKQNTDIKQQEY